MDDEKYTPPKVTAGDRVHRAIKAAISGAPCIGGPASELFDAVVIPPLSRRHDAWMEEVAAGLRVLEDRGLDLSTLAENEEFITVLVNASQAALRTHREEKRAVFRKVISHAAWGQAVGTDKSLLFIRYVDELSPAHLALFGWLAKNRSDIEHESSLEVLWKAWSIEGGADMDRDEFSYSFFDLRDRALLRTSGDLTGFSDVYSSHMLTLTSSTKGPMIRVTALGDEFLSFLMEEA